MKKSYKILLLLVMAVAIAVVPLIMIKDSEFGGADGAAEEVIEEIDPNYEPWFDSIIELPGGETESLLFALQAALGASVIGLGFGYFIGRNKEYNKQ
ncbi:energy-coupling factor ABC transporter substrate-binding protein [Ignavigranum ruoffiae]|uniref:Cobalt transport protein CbiN n=1 Tax=Ignavigranum ruoffiae TaxID=89093 RepID=A0A1H9CI92_9LACT|nr:energy-coupling factor ABC transporter substrate-binding protein [Ignavigranum ruoffiae]SEQ00338.1 cobalt/nickel transport protein [Ignavigranum ruoffiae]